MYRISYGKCVCFVLLVILAVLSCSGFRIDDLAMADVSKRNFRAADSFSNSGSVFERIFNVSSDRHRIRHRHDRQSRAQAHSARRFEPPRPPAGHIDVQVYPASPANEHFAQIPPTRPVATRLQRSSDHRRHQRQESKWLPYQEEDVSFKAYRAEIVVLAQAEGVSPNECVFKVDATYKNTKQFAVTNRVLLKIPCDQDEKHPKSKNLVKNKVQLGKSYVLFLNASSAHSYQPIGAPKLIRPSKKAKIEKVVKQVCRTKFVPTPPKISDLREVSRKKTEKRKLLCKVKGFPIPTISWRRKGEILHQNHQVRIQYRSDGTDWKQSRLTIKRMDADSWGQYECLAESANGQVVSKAISVSDPSQTLSESFSSGKECNAQLRTSYCHNGGTCHKEDSMGEYYCICAPGYSGRQCDTKEPSLSSMYHQPDIYTCKLGLSTKYYC